MRSSASHRTSFFFPVYKRLPQGVQLPQVNPRQEKKKNILHWTWNEFQAVSISH